MSDVSALAPVVLGEGEGARSGSSAAFSLSRRPPRRPAARLLLRSSSSAGGGHATARPFGGAGELLRPGGAADLPHLGQEPRGRLDRSVPVHHARPPLRLSCGVRHGAASQTGHTAVRGFLPRCRRPRALANTSSPRRSAGPGGPREGRRRRGAVRRADHRVTTNTVRELDLFRAAVPARSGRSPMPTGQVVSLAESRFGLNSLG